MKTLIVEDDFTSRLLLQSFLSGYGECHIAVNGKEAIEAFRRAINADAGYDLICMDIMMPEMDGQTALKQIRAIEEERGINAEHGVKVIMTTALDDIKNVVEAFKGLCDAYVFKPIDTAKLLGHLRAFELIPGEQRLN